MLTMPEINYIKLMRNQKSLSITQISKTLGINWRTAKRKQKIKITFGLMEAVKDGKYIDVHCLVMTLPHSNSAFAVPLPAENQECLLYGMKTIFQQLGRVPLTIRIDNMKTAVIKSRDRHEEAVFTNEFLQFANHYGFVPQACNAYSGHEKGNVENKVGYIRYNFITPSPVCIW